jgi:MFS family permease
VGRLGPVAPWRGPGHGLERSPQLRLTEETACRGDVGDRAIGMSAKEPLRFGHPDRTQFFGKRPGRAAEQAEQRPPGQVTASSSVDPGLVPGTAAIGVAAPILLVILRLLQGFAVGGEWAGAALLSAEYAPAAQRGRYGMFPQIGVGAGLAFSSLAFLLVNVAVGAQSEVFLAWAWRLPFRFSFVLLAIAVYVRLSIEETPVFREAQLASHTTRAPLIDVLRQQPKQVVLAAGSIAAIFTFVLFGGTYLTGYGRTAMGHPYWLVVAACVIGGLCMMTATAVSATLCDGIGRRAMIIAGFVVAVPWSFAVMPLIGTGSRLLFVVAIGGTFIVLGLSYGPMAAFFP